MSLFLLKVYFDQKFYDKLDLPTAARIIRNGNPRTDITALSRPSKMNCLSWSIPADYCKTGSDLHEVTGSICSKCYACRGHYKIGRTVKNALEERYQAWLTQEHWVEAMTYMINTLSKEKFRWFDSGDIQDMYMLLQITEICKRTEKTRHWLPTQEHELVTGFIKGGYEIPENLTIRLSARMIDGNPPIELAKELNNYPNVMGYIGTSGVLETKLWEESRYACPSSLQGNNCGLCTKCWARIPNIDYRRH